MYLFTYLYIFINLLVILEKYQNNKTFYQLILYLLYIIL